MRAALSLALPLLLLTACNTDFSVTKSVNALTVTPALSDFGVLAVGDSADLPLTLSTGEGAEINVLSVDVLDVEGEWFSLADDDLPTVTADEPAELTVTYAPDDEGLHWATVTVTTDEEEDAAHEVTVRGEAAVASVRIYPTLLDFGPVRRGTSEVREVTLVNEGRMPLSLEDIAFDNEFFSCEESLPLALDAGDELTVELTYEADDLTEQTGVATLDLGGGVSVDEVEVRANACSTASGDTYDHDGDGFSFCTDDCNDWDGAVHPGAPEVCDGADQDCDDDADEGTSCVDDDGDGTSEDDGDCNDGDASVAPSLTEILGNGIDDDCDGVTDDGTVDGDGDGYSAGAGDCDDTASGAFPGAPETADGTDEDCDGVIDDGTSAYDDDGDGYAEDEGDCDDTDSGATPYGLETADWIDNDCDGTVDEGTSYYDDDGDGFTETGGDCDDANANVNPGQPEVYGNPLDENCDGVTP